MADLGINRHGEFKNEDIALPIVGDDYADVIRWLKNANYIKSSRYRAQQWSAEREGAHPDLLEWERVVVGWFRRLGIPVFAKTVVITEERHQLRRARHDTALQYGEDPHNYGCAIDLMHCLRETDMPRRAWDIFGHLGHEAARATGVELEWHDGLNRPEHWEIRNWRSYFQEREAAESLGG